MKAIALAAAASLALLAACGGDRNEGELTAEESQQLNEAAEMLDASPDDLIAPDEVGLGNGDVGENAAQVPVANAQ